jgi:hypothetical protein
MRWPGHKGVPGVAPERDQRPKDASTHLGHATPRRRTLPNGKGGGRHRPGRSVQRTGLISPLSLQKLEVPMSVMFVYAMLFAKSSTCVTVLRVAGSIHVTM